MAADKTAAGAPKKTAAKRTTAKKTAAKKTAPSAGSPAPPKSGASRVSFPSLSSRAYEHPSDRAALVALRSVPGFDVLLKSSFGFFSERRLRMMSLASSVRVDDRQFAALNDIYLDAARILDIAKVPELYISQDPRVNAWTLGLDNPFIVVTTGTLDLLDDDELRVIFGHELGHVLSGHALYSSVLFTLMRIGGVSSVIPLGGLGLRAVVTALKEWYRKAELSCDRAALLVSQDPGAVTRVHMKMAGGARVGDMNLPAFLAQAEEYESTGDAREGVIRILNVLDATHPFAVVRALEIKRWVESGDYARVLAGSYPNRADDPRASFVDEVKAAAASYKQSFDQSPDPLTKFLRDVGANSANLAGWIAEQVRKVTHADTAHNASTDHHTDTED